MNESTINTDLDVSAILEKLPDTHACFYVRLADDDEDAFLFSSGDPNTLADALTGLMARDDIYVEIFQVALANYLADV